MGEQEELVQGFVEESQENVVKLEAGTAALAQDPALKDKVMDVFRAMHTLKGNSSILEFAKLEALCGAGEALIRIHRDAGTAPSAEAIAALSEATVAVKKMLEEIKTVGKEQDGQEALVDRLRQLKEVAK